MPLFKKRATEARQYTGKSGNWLEIARWANATLTEQGMVIYTADGARLAQEGDWIVKGARGFYPMMDDIFRLTYEPQEPGGSWD